jgi:hypothetical protein
MQQDLPPRDDPPYGKQINAKAALRSRCLAVAGEPMSTPVWTWGGKYFGYIDGPNLWTRDGRHVGKVSGVEIYNPAGKYIGEVKNESRLVTATNKKGMDGPSFTPLSRRTVVSGLDRGNYGLENGYEDFPVV